MIVGSPGREMASAEVLVIHPLGGDVVKKSFSILAGAALALSAALLPVTASAQSYPDRNIQFVVPWPAGGGADNFVRSLQPGVEKALGQTIVVRNTSGGGGAVGYMQASAARADGYTVTVPTNAVFTLQGLGHVQLDYQQFDYLARVFVESYVFATRSNDQWKTLKDVADEARANPRKLKIGFSGVGSSTHVMAVVLGKTMGVEFEYVPYEGGARAVAAVMGGHIDGVLLNPSEVVSAVGSGRMKAMVVTGEDRASALPDTPTMKESGYDLVVEQWRGIAAPKGVAPEVRTAWEKAVREAAADPKFVEAARNMGAEVRPLFGEELQQFVKATAELMINEAAALKQ